AVATSASREARNRQELLDRIRRSTGIEVEVIDGVEEARLVRSAVQALLGSRVQPRLVVDLGGGSLEFSLVRNGQLEKSLALPVGTVRLMEFFDIRGTIGETEEDVLRRHVLSILESRLHHRPDLVGSMVVACGGNAEALAALAPGAPVRGVPTLNFRVLKDQLWRILRLDVPGRMRAFGVRQDRAEVIGVAAIVLRSLAQFLNVREMLVPGVGVREGILQDLVSAHFGKEQEEKEPDVHTALAGARKFAARLSPNGSLKHSEHVRRLGASLFQQLSAVHGLPAAASSSLEVAAVLHDVGLAINRKMHHKHGEYMVRNAEIPELSSRRQDLIACLVRYHSRSEPDNDHKLYASFDAAQQKQIRALSALLRIADGLDCDHRQAVRAVHAVKKGKKVYFRAKLKRGPAAAVAGARRKSDLFSREFGLKPLFARAK
ncbi:MAG: HD domain-containing protein, partial [Acidobacteria bacterium]|nr:HD domain-containing protein [Acidobacteriota bacterium]